MTPEIKWYVAPHNADLAPTRGTTHSAGYDLRAAETVTLQPGRPVVKMPLGVHVAIPEGYVGLCTFRSSLRGKGLEGVGVVDADYRGELICVIAWHGQSSLTINRGERIAQLVVVPSLYGDVKTVDSLAELGQTERGAGGFGSTGK